ncbi:MAG TPA: cytochrome c [Xanthobacteraceae bacterium]|nr:cytochrome c [Xanthobacteraceae bacterium]
MPPWAVWATVLACVAAAVESARPESVTAEQVQAGADIYERNCSPCHGPRMLDPQSAFNLRNFPPDQHDRFVTSVTRGKNQMPPWGDMLKPDDVEALWAYVLNGEK